MQKEEILKQIVELHKIRGEFYTYLDESIPKEPNGVSFDFAQSSKLDAKTIYENFYRLDYQARKLAGILVKTYDIKFD